MAHYSQDEAMIKAFKENIDIHSQTASSIFGVPIDTILPEMRRTAKGRKFWHYVWCWTFSIKPRT